MKTIPISDWQHAELKRLCKMFAGACGETPERAERAMQHAVIMAGLRKVKDDLLGKVTP